MLGGSGLSVSGNRHRDLLADSPCFLLNTINRLVFPASPDWSEPRTSLSCLVRRMPPDNSSPKTFIEDRQTSLYLLESFRCHLKGVGKECRFDPARRMSPTNVCVDQRRGGKMSDS